jgi:integrase
MGQSAESITHKGQTIQIYRISQKKGKKEYAVYTLAYIANGRRTRKSFSDLAVARKEAKLIAEQLAKGTAHVTSLSSAEVADYANALKLLRKAPKDVSFTAVVDTYVRATEILGNDDILSACQTYALELRRTIEVNRVKFPDIVDSYLLEIQNAGASSRYLQDLKHRLGIAKKAFKGYIDNISAVTLGEWLDGLKVASRTRNNFRGAMMALFSHAKQKGHLPRNRQTEAELIPSRSRLNSSKNPAPIGIYKPQEIAKILRSAPDHLKPIFALGAFGGLRSSEIFRISWDQIRKDFIFVEAKNSKTASRRLVPVLPVLNAWLPKPRPQSGRLCERWSHESTFAAVMSEAIRNAGVKPVPNGLRHSWISYRLAKIKDAAKVALEAGNSPTIIFRHYREVVTPSSASAWFKVYPSKKSTEP